MSQISNVFGGGLGASVIIAVVAALLGGAAAIGVTAALVSSQSSSQQVGSASQPIQLGPSQTILEYGK